MEDSFAKVMSLAVFIVLGYLLRRFNILKDQAFAAISALVMNVTLPCVILTNLNGVRIEGDMLLIAGLGLLTNIIFLVWGLFLSRNIADTQWRDFVRLNVGGYSVGPFAVPYVQSFFPTTGLMATCMFDVGNCVMAGGGTFAVIAGTRVKTTLFRMALTLTCLSPIPAMSLVFTAQLDGDIAMAANMSSLSVGCSIIGMSVALMLFGAL